MIGRLISTSHRRRGARVVGVIAVLAVVLAGTTYAYFTSTSSASGNATTETLQPVTVTALVAGDSNAGSLLPGGMADVILRVKNTNAYPVTLVSVAGGPGAITADASHPSCTTTGVSFTNQSGLDVAIGASGTTLVRLPNAASMSTSSSNGCQGATFSIPVSITVQK